MRSLTLPGVLAALATGLMLGGTPAQADDWRRHPPARYAPSGSGIILAPGVVLQLGPTYYVPAPRHYRPAPRFGHDRRAYWPGRPDRRGWRDDHGRHDRHRGRHWAPDRGRHGHH